MERFSRIVLGYHGCEPEFAAALIAGEVGIDRWEPSRNVYDWLGEGIYFWEHAPTRAKQWGKGGVVGAVLVLGNCLDLTDTTYMPALRTTFDNLRQTYLGEGRVLPQNKGKRRSLDCLVINALVERAKTIEGSIPLQSVRCPFMEGDPAFPGSAILQESHIQIAVRDRACIAGVFRPRA